MERPRFLKYLTSKTEKPKKLTESVGADFEIKKEQAEEILLARFDRLIEQAEEVMDKNVKQAQDLVDQAEEIVEQVLDIRQEKVLIDDLENIIETKNKGEISEISAVNPEGEEIKFELKEQAQYWNKFYQEHEIDWVEPIPEDIKVTAEQAKEMERQIKELGFDWLLIVPDNLVGEPEVEEYEEIDEETGKAIIKKKLKKPAEHYEDLHKLMSKGYKNKTYQSDNYKNDGGFGGSLDKRTGLRIILTKKVQNLADDELLVSTKGKSVQDLQAKDGLFQEKGVQGLTESEYLILQRAYWEQESKHLDEQDWAWLPGSERPVSGRVPSGHWFPGGGRLSFFSVANDFRGVILGCRPTGNFLL